MKLSEGSQHVVEQLTGAKTAGWNSFPGDMTIGRSCEPADRFMALPVVDFVPGYDFAPPCRKWGVEAGLLEDDQWRAGVEIGCEMILAHQVGWDPSELGLSYSHTLLMNAKTLLTMVARRVYADEPGREETEAFLENWRRCNERLIGSARAWEALQVSYWEMVKAASQVSSFPSIRFPALAPGAMDRDPLCQLAQLHNEQATIMKELGRLLAEGERHFEQERPHLQKRQREGKRREPFGLFALVAEVIVRRIFPEAEEERIRGRIHRFVEQEFLDGAETARQRLRTAKNEWKRALRDPSAPGYVGALRSDFTYFVRYFPGLQELTKGQR